MRAAIIAHRGASGDAVENSLEAFRLAVRQGADGIELDVHATRDGGIVVHHDPAVPGLGPIAEHTLAELRQVRLTNGEPVPTLAEALAAAPGLGMWVEVKTLAAAHDAALLAVLEADPRPARCAVHSFDHRLVRRLRQLRPTLQTGVLTVARLVDPAGPLRDTGANTLWQGWHLIDRDLVAGVRGAGGKVVAWTVNDVGAARALAELGVWAICGNHPDRLRAALG